MTLKEVVKQICMLTGGKVNGEKFTAAGLERLLKERLTGAENAVGLTFSLQDGDWYCKVMKGPWGFDYIVPDTREQERRLMEEIKDETKFSYR